MQTSKTPIPFLVLIIFPVYIMGVNSLPSDITYGECGSQVQTGATEDVGFCTKVSATVQREYYMGLVELKTRVLGINMDAVTKLMPGILIFISAASYKFLNRNKD